MADEKTTIRDAATVIVIRDRKTCPKVLMGQRGAKAAFMPNKFVFPGGAVDPGDNQIQLFKKIQNPCFKRLEQDANPNIRHSICVAAIRELFEETGQILGSKGTWGSIMPSSWSQFASEGFLPDASKLQFVFRAITPPGRPRRFDARFFLTDASYLSTDQDDFSAASDELSHLQWVPLDQVRNFDLPFITEVVLAEVAARIKDNKKPESVPFFKNNDEESLFLRLKS